MRIKHFRTKNFTSLTDVDLRDIPNFAVFIGKNSSGKSNIIDALALLFLRFGTEVQEYLGAPEDFQHLFPMHDMELGEPPTIDATITLSRNDWTRVLEVEHVSSGALGEVEIQFSKSLVSDDDGVWWNTKTFGIQHTTYIRDEEVKVEQVNMSDLPDPIINNIIPLEAFMKSLSGVMSSSFSIIQTSQARQDWGDRMDERPTILDDETVSRLWDLSQSSRNKRLPWRSITRAFQGLAPNSQNPVGVDSSIQIEEGDLTVSLGMIGEGSQSMLRLVDALEHSASIVAIEEPETHLHPAAIKSVGQLLAAAAVSERQIFVCTHSPFLLEQTSLESFFVVSRESDRTTVSQLGSVSDLKQTLYSIGMKPSDILFCDAILLVEGLSDDLFFNILSHTVGISLAERHVKTIAAGGDSRGRRKIEFWAEVGRDANVPLYIILDKNAQGEAQQAIDNGHVASENCLILEKGSLEDNYPTSHLQNALAKCFGINVTSEDLNPDPDMVTVLKRVIGRKAVKNSWKPIIAEEVARLVNRREAESELRDIVDFLRRIHRELDS